MNDPKLRAQDTMVLFADLQVGIATLPLTVTAAQLGKSVRALAKLTKIFSLPTIVTVVPSGDGQRVALLPELNEVLGADVAQHARTTTDSFDHPPLRDAIVSTGRRTLLISGVATEVAVQLPALTAAHNGYRVCVVLDACGGISARSEDAALRRLVAAGVSTVSVAGLAGELARDFGQPLGQAAVGVLFEMANS